MHALSKYLSQPQAYIDEIAKMHEKSRQRGTLFSEQQDDISFYTFSLQRNKVARLLANAVANQTFQFDIADEQWIKISGSKKKLMTRQNLIDRIVHGAIFSFITQHAESHYSESLGSYRCGQSVYTVADQVRKYFQQQRKQNRKQQLDLYVLRTDISRYANTVPLTINSPLWPLIDKLLTKIDSRQPASNYLKQLIAHTINPVTRCHQSGNVQQREQGVPYGTKMAGFIYNFYIHEIDHTLNQIPGAFYRRYCDDTLIIHSDHAVIDQAYQLFQTALSDFGLALNTAKTERFYITLNGKPCQIRPEFIHSNQIDFLGFSIQANGTLRLKKKHIRRFMKSLQQRIKVAAYAARDDDLETRAQIVCQAVRLAFSRNQMIKLPKYISLIEFHDDRTQLKQLDQQIGLWVSQAVTGIPGKPSLRRVSHQQLINRWQLPSLCHLRNKGAGH